MQVRHEVAARLLEVIIERAGGRMPETLLEWRTVARRLGIEQIRMVSPAVLPTPLLRDGILWLPRVRHRYCLMMRYLAHETAEAGLEWEGEPPMVYPLSEWMDDRHRIAVLVENLAVAGAKAR
jgi:hypothetical protein